MDDRTLGLLYLALLGAYAVLVLRRHFAGSSWRRVLGMAGGWVLILVAALWLAGRLGGGG